MATRAPARLAARPIAALALFALLAAALFAPALFGGRLFVPLHTDPLLPWRASAPADEVAALKAAGNPELSDQLWLLQPNAHQIAESWRRGELPTWNRSIVGGAPLLGEALDGALYPFNALLWIVQPMERAFAWSAALHVVIAALGAWWLARRLGLDPGAALLAGLLFAASGPLLVRAHYWMTFFAATWVPWLLAAAHAFAKAPSLARWLAIPPPLALIVLTGFPQTGLYGIAGAAALGAIVLLRERRGAAWRPGAALAAAFVAGAALAAPQIAPVDEAMARSLQRPHAAQQQIDEAATPAALLGYAVPTPFTDPHEAWSLSFGRNPLWNALWSRTRTNGDGAVEPVGAGAMPLTTETCCYAGALAVGLALAALTRARRSAVVSALLAALLLAWGYALGWPWLVRSVALLPRFDVGDVRRVGPTIALLVALLAALGAQRFVAPEGRAARRVAIGATALVAIAALLLAWQVQRLGVDGLAGWFHERQLARYGAAVVEKHAAMAARSPAEDAALHAFVLRNAWSAAAWFGAGTVVLMVAGGLTARGKGGVALAAIALFGAADLATLHFRVNPFLPAARFAEPPPLLAPLAAEKSGGRVRRFAPDWRRGDDMIERLPLPPNLGGLFGIEDGEGYLVMLPTRQARWLRALEPEEQPGDTAVTVAAWPLRTVAALRSPLLTGGSVRFLLSRHDVVALLTADGGDAAGWRAIGRDGELRLFENDRALPFAFVVTEARFLPPAPADDAIGTDAEGFAPPLAADATERARLHAQALADLATDPAALRDHCWIEAAHAGGAAVLRVAGDPSRVVALDRSPTRIVVTLAPGAGGWLVVNEGFDPGWRATIDGVAAPVVPANVAWRGVALPAGAREVRLDYRPAAARNGFVAAGAAGGGWLALAIVALVSGARARRRPDGPPASAP